MVGNRMRENRPPPLEVLWIAHSLAVLGLVGSFGVPVQGQVSPSVFEEVVSGPRGAWRTAGGGSTTIIKPEGFLVVRGQHVMRFRWDSSMHLTNIVADQGVQSHSFLLDASGHESRALQHARCLRAVSKDQSLSIVYYFGSRGLEFDIDEAPGKIEPKLRLDSLDANFTMDRDERLFVDGLNMLLRPVAFQADRAKGRHRVPATYHLRNARSLEFRVSKRNSRERLVIDPVMTYATYFGGSVYCFPATPPVSICRKVFPSMTSQKCLTCLSKAGVL
jgi:hypothetical protein